MYKVYCDDTLVCDSRVEELALTDPVVNLEENKAGSFSFKMPPAHPLYGSIKRRKSVIQVYQNDDLIFSGICIKEKEDFYKQKVITCEGELTYLNDTIQRPKYYQGKNVRGLLEAYIAVHNSQVEERKQFTVGMVTVSDDNDYISCYTNMQTTMKELKEDLVDDLGGFLQVRHSSGVKYIDYLADSQNTNTQEIRIGRNLLDFTKNFDSSDIATAIIPQGAKLEETTVEGLETRLTIESVNDGLDYVHSPEAVGEYGWIYKTVTWDGVTTPDALKAKAEKYLSDIQFENMVIEAKAIDLNLTNQQMERFKLSDQIRVVSAPHGLDRYFRLTKMTINLNNPDKNTITLGKSETVKMSARMNKENEKIKKAIEIMPSTILQNAVQNATQLIQNATNGFVTTVMNDDGTPKELLIMDIPDIATATKVWRWNVNGLGYSSNGYDGPYELAMTMDGTFVADFIKAGNMSADRLHGGILKLGGKDDTNGRIEVYDENGGYVGYWSKNGICLRSTDGKDYMLLANGYQTFTHDETQIGGTGHIVLHATEQDYIGLGIKVLSDIFVIASDTDSKYILNPNNKPINGDTETHIFKSTVRFKNRVNFGGDFVAEGNAKVKNEFTAETVICNKMSVQGGAPQSVEWVWDSNMQRWCLCTIT